MTFAFECGAFDPRLMRSGTASLVWNTATGLAARGHTVSIVTPAHGLGGYLRERYGAEDTGFSDEFAMPLLLDPSVWRGFPPRAAPRLCTTALRLRRQGVDLYFLSNSHLDLLARTFVPPAGTEGRDLAYFKEQVFQVTGVRFIRQVLGDADLVQAYEPHQHYLLPAALGAAPGIPVVSTVATNVPVNLKVHRAQAAELLAFLGAHAGLDEYADPPEEPGALHDVLRRYLPATLLDPPERPGYVACHSLAFDHAAAVDFMTPGQREHCVTFANTPFEERFGRLTISRVLRRNADKVFVGGCAISGSWLRREPPRDHRRDFLTGLGLDPALPTFYHGARYAPDHKGQSELFEALAQVLGEGLEANFLIRCAQPGGSELPPELAELADKYQDRVRADGELVDEPTLFAYAAAADFCVFPSKFEMDTFLIAQGEAMAFGAVPIATEQAGTRHFGQAFDWRERPEATGFALPRSFRPDDDLLRDRLAEQLREAAHLFHHDAGTYARLSGRARRTARSFTWEASARLREYRFRGVLAGAAVPTDAETLIRRGWYDGLDDDAWTAHRELIALTAAAQGRPQECVRACAGRPDLAAAAFDTAYRAARFRVCAALDTEEPPPGAGDFRRRLRVRSRADRTDVTYHFPHAERVELFRPEADGPPDGFGQVMRRHGDTFRGSVPGPLGEGPLVLLITLPRGRFVWDEVRPSPEH
ncbi:glycosyltransferase [Streptomyces sp. NPDC048106]|uniref:glycosyltransferase n=1 Tax=Streptomyces sp. NPDC048106 TaxID=3155750 RepID=UPI00345263A0